MDVTGSSGQVELERGRDVYLGELWWKCGGDVAMCIYMEPCARDVVQV